MSTPTAPSDGRPDVLPEGVRLVHIGPHKTGTTAVQFALHQARESLRSQGVLYAGSSSQAYLPALGLTGRTGRIGGPSATEQDWLDLVAEVEAVGQDRVVMSSESFCHAKPKNIARLARDLDPDRVHIVRMVRRYDKLLPSQWQQQISGGGRKSYQSYLDAVLTKPDHVFWQRHSFDQLTRVWADVVGADHVTVVVVNEDDRDWLPQVFERFLDLDPGTLKADEGKGNRSLTMGEVEMLRSLNEVRVERGWVDRVHFEFVRRGISPALRGLPADPAGGRIQLPAELFDAMAEATQQGIDALLGLGVRVVGDVEWLRMPAEPPGQQQVRPSVSIDSALAATRSVIEQTTRFPVVDTEPDQGKGGPAQGSLGAPQPVGLAVSITPTVRAGRWTHVSVVPADEVASSWLSRCLRSQAPPKESSRRRGLSLEMAGARRAERKRPATVLALTPPQELLLAGWQEHLAGRGTLDLDTWLARHPPTVVPAETLVADEPGTAYAGVLSSQHPEQFVAELAVLARTDPADLVAASEVVRSVLSYPELCLRRVLNAQEWDDATLARYVAAGVEPWLMTGATPEAWTHTLPPLAHGWCEGRATETRAALEDAGVHWLGSADGLAPTASALGPDEQPRLDPVTVAVGVSGAIALADPSYDA